MTWELQLLAVFDDLEQQAEGLALRERDATVAELARAEFAEVTLLARWHAAVGRQVDVAVAGVGRLQAELRRVGPDWLLLDDRSHEWMVRQAAVDQVRGLPDGVVADAARPLTARLGFGSALRSVADERVPVAVHSRAGAATRGLVRRVGADFLELWVSEHAESWATGRPGHLEVLPFEALAAVRRT